LGSEADDELSDDKDEDDELQGDSYGVLEAARLGKCHVGPPRPVVPEHRMKVLEPSQVAPGEEWSPTTSVASSCRAGFDTPRCCAAPAPLAAGGA
jgi:hypothetical protein